MPRTPTLDERVVLVSRNRAPPSLIYSAEDKFIRSTEQDSMMFTKSRTAMSFAVILSAASVPLSTHAFAENNRLDWDGYATNSQSGRGEAGDTEPYHQRGRNH